MSHLGGSRRCVSAIAAAFTTSVERGEILSCWRRQGVLVCVLMMAVKAHT